jgi:hypothetical protein
MRHPPCTRSGSARRTPYGRQWRFERRGAVAGSVPLSAGARRRRSQSPWVRSACAALGRRDPGLLRPVLCPPGGFPARRAPRRSRWEDPRAPRSHSRRTHCPEAGPLQAGRGEQAVGPRRCDVGRADDRLSTRHRRARERAVRAGWATYPVALDGVGVDADAYYGLAVQGRCGDIDNSLTPKTMLPPAVPEGEAVPGRRGLLFEHGSWTAAICSARAMARPSSSHATCGTR